MGPYPSLVAHGPTIGPASSARTRFPAADEDQVLCGLNKLLPAHEPIVGKKVRLLQQLTSVSDSVYSARVSTEVVDADILASAASMVEKPRD